MGVLLKLTRVVLIIVLPFFILIRGSMFIHNRHDLGPWLALGGGALITAFLLFIYMTSAYLHYTAKLGDRDNLRRRSLFALALVVLYCGYGLFFISADNFKNPALQSEINDLHPLLRLGVSTFILLDKDMIITDASRTPEDYRRMGLKTAKNSLHYPQKDGYAYAIDLRTNDRHEVRNSLMRFYFLVLGFNTLRHSGTDDHLHVSLRCHYRPGSK